jgi:intracellular septation protein A
MKSVDSQSVWTKILLRVVVPALFGVVAGNVISHFISYETQLPYMITGVVAVPVLFAIVLHFYMKRQERKLE